jgi:hypothetical protein
VGRVASAVLERLFPHDSDDRKIAVAAAAIWLAVLALAVAYALLQPVWSVVDEGPHFGYVELIAEDGDLPRAGDTVVSESVLAIGRDRQWGWQYPRDPALRLETGEVPAHLPQKDVSLWVRDNLWRFNYEAIQPPMYYLLAAVVYLAVPGSTIVKVYAVRVFSAILASLVVIVSYRLARRVAPGSRVLLIGAPASFAILQGYLLNSSQVTNDSLAGVVGGLVVLLLVTFWQTDLDQLDRPKLLAGGAVLGAALLTKSVLWYLAPLVVVVFVVRLGLRAGVRKLVPVMVASMAMFVPWLARNLLVYGEATGQSRMSRFLGAFFPAPSFRGAGSVVGYVISSSRHMLLSYIWGEPTWVWAYRSYNVAAALGIWAMALMGWVLWILRRRAVEARPRLFERHSDTASLRMQGLLIAISSVIAGYLFMLALPLFGGIAVVGRYMYPVAAPVSVAAVFGLSSLFNGPRLRVAFSSVLLAVFVLLNAVNLVAWTESGRSTSRVADGLTYLQGVREPRTRWYFGPGRNEGGFVDLIYLFNPTDLAASVNINYFPGGKTIGVRRVVVMPREGITVNTRFDRGGGYGAGHLTLGAMVDSDVPIVAGRGTFFFVSDRGWTGGSISSGVPEPSTDAYFPAGRTGEGFSQVLGFLNPSDRDAHVSIEYIADGRSIESTVVVPARAPLRVDAASNQQAGGLGASATSLSTVVRSSEPIVVERQLYYSLGGVSGGDWSNPASLSTTAVFPAVFSGVGYHPTLVAYNPAPDSARVSLEYVLESGRREARDLQLPPGRSDVDLDVASGAGLGVVSGVYSLTVQSSHPIALELESLVQDGAFSDGFIEHSLDRSGTYFAFPFATTNPDFRSEVVIFNPSGEEATVRIDYYPSRLVWLPSPLDTEVSKSFTLAPGELRRIDLRTSPEGVSATKDSAFIVTSNRDIYAGATLFFVHSF